LSRLQFFKPHGDQFGEAQKGNGFSCIDLVKFRQTDGQPIPNANRQHYMMELLKKLEPDLRKLASGNARN
jgi:internalin A